MTNGPYNTKETFKIQVIKQNVQHESSKVSVQVAWICTWLCDTGKITYFLYACFSSIVEW